MAFQVTEEAVAIMRDLSKKLPQIIDHMHAANNEVLLCYDEVKDTVGPHTRQIESIVKGIEKLLNKNAENIVTISHGLNKYANKCQLILDNSPEAFKKRIKTQVPSTDSTTSVNMKASNDPVNGPRERQLGNGTQYDDEGR